MRWHEIRQRDRSLVGAGDRRERHREGDAIAVVAVRLEAVTARDAGGNDGRVHQQGPDPIGWRVERVGAGDVHGPPYFRRSGRRRADGPS